LTALSNATALATQHIASTSATEPHRGWAMVRYVATQPLWLLGWLALVGSLVFQALALHFGPLATVQPLLVSELVLSLALRRLFLRQRLAPITWRAGLLAVLSLALFLVVATPHGRDVAPSPLAWRVTLLTGGLVTLACVLGGLRGSPDRRAASWGAATGLSWALEATFIKAGTDSIAQHGLWGAFAHWPLYAFALGGVVGLLCEQMALHVGPLRSSQPFIVIVDPLISLALGYGLFRERLHASALALTLAVVAFGVLCASSLVLLRTSPETMRD
jgi:drug/metabolite transporter (DMT)-like permease